MTGALDHPLVAGYLRELDGALAGLPAAAAAELSDQIRAHLLEALPADPDRESVIAVIAALGPARLVAEASAGQAGSARLGRPMRRAVAWFRRLPVIGQLAAAALVAAIALLAGLLIYWPAQPGLQYDDLVIWWSRVDLARQVQTQAAGATQNTVPIRPGHIQGFAIFVYNPSGMTQFITGSAGISPGAGASPRIDVSTTGSLYLSGEPHAVSYRHGGPIPPHSYRWIRVMWRSAHCYLNDAGSSQGSSDVLLRVRVGWITRTEDINFLTEYAVTATKASVRADAAYCRTHPQG